MGRDLATEAELVKLARALDTTRDGVAFASSLDRDAIRELRERVVVALYDEHRAVFQRVAAVSKLLPTALNVRIALRAFPPLLAARIAGEMAPDRAAEVANRMPVEYLAEGCVHLDPRRAASLITYINPERALAVVLELVERGEFITLGRLLDLASERLITDVSASVSDEILLRMAAYADSSAQLTRAMLTLPGWRLRRVVHRALTGTPDLRWSALSLLGRLTDDRLRGRLAGYAAEEDDEALTKLLHTAIDDGAVAELLTAVAAMSGEAQRRVLALPALADRDTLTHLVCATERHDLWHRLAPLVEHMDAQFLRNLAVVTESFRHAHHRSGS